MISPIEQNLRFRFITTDEPRLPVIRLTGNLDYLRSMTDSKFFYIFKFDFYLILLRNPIIGIASGPFHPK